MVTAQDRLKASWTFLLPCTVGRVWTWLGPQASSSLKGGGWSQVHFVLSNTWNDLLQRNASQRSGCFAESGDDFKFFFRIFKRVVRELGRGGSRCCKFGPIRPVLLRRILHKINCQHSCCLGLWYRDRQQYVQEFLSVSSTEAVVAGPTNIVKLAF